MQLFLIRHASAIDRAPSGMDGDRALSPEGRKEAMQVAAVLKKLAVNFSSMLSSPLVRAVETADLIAVGTDYGRSLEIRSELSPEGAVKEILATSVAPYIHLPSVALVGHEPSMGHLLSHLLRQSDLSLEKAAIACLDLESADATAILRWTISPRCLQPHDSL
jgi:phosphohistidine phosphatase